MPETDLGQPEFIYNSCGPFSENREKTHKFLKKRIIKIYYQRN